MKLSRRRFPFSPREHGGSLSTIPMGASVVWSPQNSISPEFLYIAGGLLLAVALLLVVLHRRQRKHDEEPLTPLEDPAFIHHVFAQCTDQRIRMAITCSRSKVSSTQAAGHLLFVEESKHDAPLTVVLTEAPKAEEWAEAPVDIYFHFTTAQEKTFYHFSSFVLNLHQVNGAWQMALARPSVLTNNQRREFVRVAPPTGSVEALTVWPQLTALLPTNPRDLGRPPFAYRPPRVVLVQMMDISAGGMRLHLSVPQVRAKQVRCAPGMRFVALFMVDALRTDGSRQMLWLSATVCRAVLTADKAHVELGLQFTHWAPAATLTDPISWEPVEADGEVPFLLRWVSRVNTLLARMQ